MRTIGRLALLLYDIWNCRKRHGEVKQVERMRQRMEEFGVSLGSLAILGQWRNAFCQFYAMGLDGLICLEVVGQID